MIIALGPASSLSWGLWYLSFSSYLCCHERTVDNLLVLDLTVLFLMYLCSCVTVFKQNRFKSYFGAIPWFSRVRGSYCLSGLNGLWSEHQKRICSFHSFSLCTSWLMLLSGTSQSTFLSFSCSCLENKWGEWSLE